MARAGPSRRCSARSRSREQRPATARVLSPFQFLERTGQDLSLLELTVGFDSYGGPRAKVKAVAHLGMRRSDAWSHSSSQSSKSVAELCDLSKNSYPGKAAMTKKMPTMMNIWRTVNFPRTTSSAVHGMAKSARNVRAARGDEPPANLLPLGFSHLLLHLMPPSRRRGVDGHASVVREACQGR